MPTLLGTLQPGYVENLERLSQQLPGGVVLVFAVLMEVAIVMIPLSKLLPYQANRWAHFLAIPLTILWVVVPSLLPGLGGSTPLSYVFFAAVEVATLLGMLWYVSLWPRPEDKYAHLPPLA